MTSDIFFLLTCRQCNKCLSRIGDRRGPRGAPFASLTPYPPTIYFVICSANNSYLAGPSRCSCARVHTPSGTCLSPIPQQPGVSHCAVGCVRMNL